MQFTAAFGGRVSRGIVDIFFRVKSCEFSYSIGINWMRLSAFRFVRGLRSSIRFRMQWTPMCTGFSIPTGA